MRPAIERTRALTERLVTGVAVLAGAALLYGLLGGFGDSGVETGPPTAPRGYFATDATLTEMGPTGRPRFVVHAREIEQQLSDQSVLFTDVALDYRAKDLGTWHVTAQSGRMPQDRKSLLLSGDVTVTGAEDRGGAVIRTQQIAYDIDGGVVQTDQPVSVRFGAHQIEARGLKAMLNNGTLQLESDVNGRFIP